MICKLCNREFKTIQALSSHMGWHNKPNRISNFKNYNSKVKIGDIEKKFTNQYTKAKELGQPIPEVSEETKKKVANTMKNKMIEFWKSEENRKKQSEYMKKAVLNNPNSYSSSNVSGRVKSYEFIDSYGNKTKLKGKWELKVATLLNEKNIKWTNIIEPTPYYWNDGWHLYFPDFFLPEKNLYLEIKGYQRDRDIQKWKYFKGNLFLIKKK